VLSLLQEALPPNSFVDRAQVDVQVEALLWHNIEVFISDHPMLPPPYNEAGHYETRYALNETSGWSNTQTITIPASGSSSSPSSSSSSSTSNQTEEPSPSQATESAANDASQTLQLEAIIGTVVAVVVLTIILLVYFKKRKH
jgi:cobalamin biosynthesis Mg chelatase CobN